MDMKDSILNNLLEMIRIAPPSCEELGEQDRPVEMVQPALHPVQDRPGLFMYNMCIALSPYIYNYLDLSIVFG